MDESVRRQVDESVKRQGQEGTREGGLGSVVVVGPFQAQTAACLGEGGVTE